MYRLELTSRVIRYWPIIIGLLLSGLFAGSRLGITPTTALAHGREVAVVVTSLAPDKDNPLTKLYRVTARFDDGDPVTGAQVQLLAKRTQGDLSVGPVALVPFNEPGVYAGELTYPRFGAWAVTVTVRGDVGEGSTAFDEELLPGSGAEPNAQPGEEAVRQLQVTFRFGVQDLAHIAVRIMHSVAATAYIAFTGAVLLAIWFRASDTRPEVWNWLRRAFFSGTLVAASVLLASGLYLGYYDAPVKSPGTFSLSALGRIPYGYAYLAAFWLKAPLAVALLGIALRIHRAMNPRGQLNPIAGASVDRVGDVTSTPHSAPLPNQLLLRLSLAYVVVGLLLLANIAVLIYLHYISHLGAVVSLG